MSTRSAESRSHSPDGDAEQRTSKKRKVLSCYACRNRKMKCDRVYPVCGRCQRTGRADQCTYDPRLIEDLQINGDTHLDGATSFAQPDHAPNGNFGSFQGQLRIQERRLELLERKLVGPDHGRESTFNTPSRLDAFTDEGAEPKFAEQMLFRGKSYKTHFYGSTSPMTLISQIEFNELQAFTREAMSVDSSMHRIRCDFKSFRNRRKAMIKEKGLEAQGTDMEILGLVPDRGVLDPVVTLYFDTIETSFRILHEPTFRAEYSDFWQPKQNENTPLAMAVALVYITAIMKCLSVGGENMFIGDSSSDREAALRMIESCDLWLLRQSSKHPMISFFQLKCLSLLAKRVNCVKIKQDWTNSGELIRLAIASGLHRNPELIAGKKKLSEFDKEMRRRLWVTIAELELQSSIDCGLPSSLGGLYFDVQAPSNLPDEALSGEMKEVPAGRPLDSFTPTSYLILSLRSLPLRVHLMQLLNNPTTNLQYSDVVHYDTRITSLLSALPSWNDPRAGLPLALLSIQLHQYLIMLHLPYAKIASTNPRFTFSLTSCVNATSSLVSLHDDLVSKGSYLLNHLRNDAFRAGMSLAQLAYHNCPFTTHQPDPSNLAPTPASTNASHHLAKHMHPDQQHTTKAPCARQGPPPGALRIPHFPTKNLMLKTMVTTSIEVIEKAITVFEAKVMRLGTGYMEYWLLSAGTGIMPTSDVSATYGNADDLRARGKKAIDRITRLCFRVLAMQKDPNIPIFLGTDTDATSRMLRGGMDSIGVGGGGMADTAGAWDGLNDMQVDMSGWTFPDFWAFDVGGDF
ncbi:hypothetical protein BDV96DRAFT_614211 [Lophiotrema nucula]|uniref:Zn(2)-C6 fungal-type domain-containing protein n=1 Tax=Lophiotrema nucula TaxID=690887 RepID=A0A6A5YYH9_9PLEO|nr:hypothetical protein BDV96DRAFT_614211 [Lophiotrema nucula]